MNEQTGQQETPQPLYVSLILDESGSMQSCKRAAIAGFNQYVKSLQDEPAPTWFTLTLFNAHWTEVRYHGVPVATVPELDVETYRPQDTTPLYDAIGHTLAAARKDAPVGCKKLCVILTDGLENSSKEFTRKQIYALIISRTASRKAGGLSIWVPITTRGRRAKTWASPKNAEWPFRKTALGTRSISSQP